MNVAPACTLPQCVRAATARLRWARGALPLLLVMCAVQATAHDLSADNAAYVQSLSGPAVGPFLYLGAKHMLTGLDHLLFLLGVIFLLSRARDIITYITLFTLGHSITLMLGVWFNWQVNVHLVDAVIGLSIVYKAFENLGGFKHVLGLQPSTHLAVLVFGLCHGLGLATKLQGYISSGDGLLTNLISFNIGVELGQILALTAIAYVLLLWRSSRSFGTSALAANAVLMCLGFILTGRQIAAYVFA